MARDLYSVLGVARDADPDAIKKAFRKLAVQLHPDKNPGKEAQFKEVSTAYDVLGDKDKRALYDEFGDESLSQGFDPDRARVIRQYGGGARAGRSSRPPAQGGFDVQDIFGGASSGGDFSDLFGDLFSRSRGSRPPRPVKGQDIASEVTIDFVSAVKGTSLELRPAAGAGEPVTVRVPPGADEGSRLRIRGQGVPGTAGGPAGDLILEIHVRPHPFFRRDGDDLRLDVPISVGEAYRGDKIRIPTPEGDVTLKVPRHAKSGQETRLRGKGVARKGKEAGDLYVRFLIQLPTDEDPAMEEAVEMLDVKTEPLRTDLRF